MVEGFKGGADIRGIGHQRRSNGRAKSAEAVPLSLPAHMITVPPRKGGFECSSVCAYVIIDEWATSGVRFIDLCVSLRTETNVSLRRPSSM